jgi:hypothetical protein
MIPWPFERRRAGVEVRLGPLGRGIHARRAFRAGDRILKFTGPVLTHEQVLALGDAQAYALQVGPDQYIDTAPPGRYTNHSCVPNAGIISDRVLIAIKPIASGEEIRFDYSTTMSENHWTLECRCGEPECRRVIRDFHLLPPALQERYVERGIVQAFILHEWKQRRRRGVGPGAPAVPHPARQQVRGVAPYGHVRSLDS